jgi:hypothetical protein
MARLCQPDSPYGCGHHDEHVAAARLGWTRRRAGVAFEASRQQRYLSRVVGQVHSAHRHPDHPGVVAFKRDGKWYEMSRMEFRRLVGVGRRQEEQERKEQARQRREQREIARFYELTAREERQAELGRRREERGREREQAHLRAVQRAERAEVVKLMREYGVRQESEDRSEYELLPAEVRRKEGRFTMDTAREHVMLNMPWLNLETTNDLTQYFERSKVKRQRDFAHGRLSA